MKPLHQILPPLLDAVRHRREDPDVAKMSDGELRELVYQLAEHANRGVIDGKAMLEELLASTRKKAADFSDQRSSDKYLRADMLDWILTTAQRSIALVGTPVRQKIEHRGTSNEITNDPYLRGLEISSHRRRLRQDDGGQSIFGHSWWVVTLAFDDRDAMNCSLGRWAKLTHEGELDKRQSGTETITVEIVDSLVVADQISNHVIGGMLQALLKRMQSSDAEYTNLTEKDRSARRKLECALEVLSPTVGDRAIG